jgi:hypothetical protein
MTRTTAITTITTKKCLTWTSDDGALERNEPFESTLRFLLSFLSAGGATRSRPPHSALLPATTTFLNEPLHWTFVSLHFTFSIGAHFRGLELYPPFSLFRSGFLVLHPTSFDLTPPFGLYF